MTKNVDFGFFFFFPNNSRIKQIWKTTYMFVFI